jgi:hypothetical protein
MARIRRPTVGSIAGAGRRLDRPMAHEARRNRAGPTISPTAGPFAEVQPDRTALQWDQGISAHRDSIRWPRRNLRCHDKATRLWLRACESAAQRLSPPTPPTRAQPSSHPSSSSNKSRRKSAGFVSGPRQASFYVEWSHAHWCNGECHQTRRTHTLARIRQIVAPVVLDAIDPIPVLSHLVMLNARLRQDVLCRHRRI